MDAILTKKAEELAKDLAGQATTCHSSVRLGLRSDDIG